jgi:hypothetical protein
MSASMTYDSLITDIPSYAERTSDTTFIAQVPRFVMLAENRIAAEARGLGFMRSVTDNLVPSQSFLAKPARWRETYSLQIGTGSGNNTRVTLFLRALEYCRTYWPNPTVTGTPKYYADWDYQNWLLVPTPLSANPYELIYHERPEPLDGTHQTNWTTEYAPQLLLYACLLEAQPFLKQDDRMKVFQQEYDRALKQTEFEQRHRMIDRAAQAINA